MRKNWDLYFLDIAFQVAERSTCLRRQVGAVIVKEVADFVSTKLSTIDGVVSTTTHFMLKKYKFAGVIIKDEEEEHRLVVSP